jgi:membrane-associated phospholipid phosphatase
MQRVKKILLVTFLVCNYISYNAQNSDIKTLRSINSHRNSNLDGFFKGLTDSDAPVAILSPALIFTIGLINKDSLTKAKGIEIAGSLLISSIFTTGLKHSIKRDRPFVTYPDIEQLAPAGSPSFPSGHTSMAFASATSFSIICPKWFVIIPAYLWASSIGYSRMHLGVHYPSDVLVGAVIGSGSSLLSRFLNKKLRGK